MILIYRKNSYKVNKILFIEPLADEYVFFFSMVCKSVERIARLDKNIFFVHRKAYILVIVVLYPEEMVCRQSSD